MCLCYRLLVHFLATIVRGVWLSKPRISQFSFLLMSLYFIDACCLVEQSQLPFFVHSAATFRYMIMLMLSRFLQILTQH